MSNPLVQKMLGRIPTAERIALLRDVLDLSDSDITISTTPDPAVFRFTFYGDACSFTCQSILDNIEKFKSYLANRVAVAQGVYEEGNQVLSALENDKEFDINEFYEDAVPKAETEEQLSEIFEGNIEAFRQYYNSPARQKCPQDVRGFLQQVATNPFMPLWEGT